MARLKYSIFYLRATKNEEKKKVFPKLISTFLYDSRISTDDQVDNIGKPATVQ